MFTKPNTGAQPTFRSNFPAADTAAVITVDADADHIHVLHWIHAGFDLAPLAAAKLNVTINAVEVWAVDIPANLANAGPHEFQFPDGLFGSNKNEAMVITLATGGAGKTGKINAKTT